MRRNTFRSSLRCIRSGLQRCGGWGPPAPVRESFGFGSGACVADVAGLERLIEPEVKSLGYELVRVMMIGGASDPTLQVMAERGDTRQLHIVDCERISRHLSEM